MIDQDGRRPGDPDSGVRAVIAALGRDAVPHRLVLGGAGHDAVTSRLEAVLAEVREQESAARSADFPPGA